MCSQRVKGSLESGQGHGRNRREGMQSAVAVIGSDDSDEQRQAAMRGRARGRRQQRCT